MSGFRLRRQQMMRTCAISASAVGALCLLSACGTSIASSGITATPTPSKSKSSPTATADPTATSSPRPTYSRKVTPTPKPTKVSPIFVASLPGSVSAVVGQKIVVQLATEKDQRWSASGSGPVTVGGTTYVAPPEEQPDAPGTSITTVTAKSTGNATVTFTSKSTEGGSSSTKKLVIKIK
jgi:hypothetical protein